MSTRPNNRRLEQFGLSGGLATFGILLVMAGVTIFVFLEDSPLNVVVLPLIILGIILFVID